jgi:hypothetical protein
MRSETGRKKKEKNLLADTQHCDFFLVQNLFFILHQSFLCGKPPTSMTVKTLAAKVGEEKLHNNEKMMLVCKF